MKRLLSVILALALLLTAFSAFAEESGNTPPGDPPAGADGGTPPELPEGFDGSNPPGEPPEGFGGGTPPDGAPGVSLGHEKFILKQGESI